MSLGPVAKLRGVVAEGEGAPPSAEYASPFSDGMTLSVGDLRQLLLHIVHLERSLTTLQTPSDSERRCFIRRAAIALRAQLVPHWNRAEAGSLDAPLGERDANDAWAEAQTLWSAKPEDC